MANAKTRAKRRDHRLRKKSKAEEEFEEPDLIAKEDDTESETDPEPVEKDMGYMIPQPTSYEELDALRVAQEKAEQVRRESWNVQDLVYNIAYADMTPEQKSKAIINVGKGFGTRLKAIATDTMEKELDMDVLQLQALLARDARHTSVVEKAGDLLANAFTTPKPDSKTYLRKQLRETLGNLQQGDGSMRESVQPLLKEAKAAGVGDSPSAILIEKDISGSWRSVMWPTNNFQDLDGETLSEKSHLEYVDWVNKNMDCAPAFVVGHIPGTARESVVDFVGYENGFLIMSSPLTEKEAADLLRMQVVTDIGMSHGTFALGRDVNDPNIITKYRMVEVSDLPLERAANPFTDFEVLSKEADMNVKEYLTQMLGAERAEVYMAKAALKQETLRKAGVEEKETKPAETPAPAVSAAPAPKIDELVERLSKEFGMQELSQTIATLVEKADKVDVLEALIKDMAESEDDKLAEKISPPVEKQLSWMRTRPTQTADNILKEGDDASAEDKKLKKAKPEAGWLAEAAGVEPVYQ